MSNTNNHVNIALCAPRDRIVVLEGIPEESSAGELQIRHNLYQVVAIVTKGSSNSASHDYLIHHEQFGPTELRQLVGQNPISVFSTFVCPGSEAEDRKVIDAATKHLDERLTKDFKELRGIS